MPDLAQLTDPAPLWLLVCRCPPCLDKVVSYDPITGSSETVTATVTITRTGRGEAKMQIVKRITNA